MIRYKMKPDEEITEETAEKRKNGENTMFGMIA